MGYPSVEGREVDERQTLTVSADKLNDRPQNVRMDARRR